MKEKKLQLPADFKDLGLLVTIVRSAKLPAHVLGRTDRQDLHVELREGLSRLGEISILVHEMMHVTEGVMHQRGQLTHNIDHDFIAGASLGIAIALARCGALPEVTDAEIAAFIAEARTREEIAPPGSQDALKRGCTCPVGDNCHGAGYRGAGRYLVDTGCPLHGDLPDGSDELAGLDGDVVE